MFGNCPECGGVGEKSHGEVVCADCGLVLDDTPETMADDPYPDSDGRRDEQRYKVDTRDKSVGLGSVMGYDRSSGNRQWGRMRTENARAAYPDGTDRSVKKVIDQVRFMSSKLDLPSGVDARAAVIARKWAGGRDNGLAGLDVDTIAPAVLVAACRDNGVPTEVKRVAPLAKDGVGKTEIFRWLKQLQRDGFGHGVQYASDYVPRVLTEASEYGTIRQEVRAETERFARLADETPGNEASAKVTAVGALCAAKKTVGLSMQYCKISEATNVSDNSWRPVREWLLELDDAGR